MRIWDQLRRFFRWCSGGETWNAIIAVQGRCDNLSDRHEALSNSLDDLVRQVGEMQRVRTLRGESFQKQIDDLRAVVAQIGKETPLPVHVARNFADVRRFLREDEDGKV